MRASPLSSTRLHVLVAFVLAVLAAGCASLTPTVPEPMRIGNTSDLSADALGLRAGVTTFDDARATLHARGLTGIAEDRFQHPAVDALDEARPPARGTLLGVLAADYQRRIHVFREGRYHESLELPDGGALPYGFALRLGADDTSTLLLVLHRDPLHRATQPPRLLTYRWRTLPRASAPTTDGDDPYAEVRPHFELTAQVSLAQLARRHRGMTRPILVGTTFTDGVLLFARDARGRIWDRGYLVRSTADAVALTPIPWATAMRCSCVQTYSMQ